MSEAFQQQAAKQAGRHGLAHVDENDEYGGMGAVIAGEVGQPRVAAALGAHVLMGDNAADDHRAVEVAQQVGDNGGNDNGKYHFTVPPCRPSGGW